MKTETDIPFLIKELDEEMRRQLELKDKPKKEKK